MLKSFYFFWQTSTFLHLFYKEIQFLLKSDNLTIGNEDLVLKCLIKWIEYEPENNQFEDFLGNVNMVTINVSSENTEGDQSDEVLEMKSDERRSYHCQHDGVTEQNSLETNSNERKYNYSRKEKLTDLLKLVRTCLVSPEVLLRFCDLDVISENKTSRDIIVKALSYHAIDWKLCQWPKQLYKDHVVFT